MIDVHQLNGDWIFITPVGNLVLTDAVNREFRVNDVLFIDGKKLSRIRRRLGISTTISELKKSPPEREFFESSQTFAIVKQSGKPTEIKNQFFRSVRDALAILALSQLGYAKRRSTGYIGLLGEHELTRVEYLFLNTSNAAKGGGSRLTRSPHVLRLDGLWKRYQQEMFFTKLLRILSGEIKVSRNWRDDLRRASILIGQGINSNDVPTSFLWNMIALELLLTRQGDKYPDALQKRSEAFLGWIGFWSTENYEERIEQLYQKRVRLVHYGDREAISKQDLLFSDDLLLNLLINIVNYSNIFTSKGKIVDFAERVEAEHKLGLKSKVRPKKLIFTSRRYTKQDLDEV